MAQAEASIIASSNLAQLHALDNIQSADVILKVLNDHENILVTKWDDNSPIPTDRLLVASGKRWTALLKDRQDCWSEYHRRSRFPIHSITDFLTHKIKQGTVYSVAGGGRKKKFGVSPFFRTPPP